MENDASIGESQVIDPSRLFESAEELATLANLARQLGCSGKALKALLRGPLRTLVRFAHRKPGPVLYSMSDAREHFEPHRAEVEARRQRALEVEAAACAAAVAAKAARVEADAKRKAGAAQFSPTSRRGSVKPPK
jgi:hypothetical protein